MFKCSKVIRNAVNRGSKMKKKIDIQEKFKDKMKLKSS